MFGHIVRRVSSGAVRRLPMRVSATVVARRFEATVGSASEPSAVNVEEFTLNEEVVKMHLEIAGRWRQFDEELQSYRDARQYDKILEMAARGLTLLAEVGPMNSPVQCETNLLMESAQAHFNLGQAEPALKHLQQAKESLKAAADCDAAKVAEIDEFIGHVLLLKGEAVAAETQFRDVLHWIDNDSRKAMPMVAVAAVNQRRSVLAGVGLALKARADKEAATETGGDSKALFAQALDITIDALNLHIEANDFTAVKQSFATAVQCFVGVGDVAQALKTTQRYMSWCNRHKDYSGVLHGAAMMKEVCAAQKIAPTPLEENKDLAEMVTFAEQGGPKDEAAAEEAAAAPAAESQPAQ